MARIKDMLSDERPRERLWERGASSLKVSELLAILIRTGMKGTSAVALSEQLLSRYRTLDHLARVSARELAKIKGLGMAKAVQLKAAFELGVRLSRSRALEQPVETPQDVQRLLGEEMRQLPHESLRVLVVNTRLKLVAVEELSRGTINETVAHPRDILRHALLHRAYGIILVHNHPSGDPAPSPADLDFTLGLKEAAQLLQVYFIDHIILGSASDVDRGYYSFKETGYL